MYIINEKKYISQIKNIVRNELKIFRIRNLYSSFLCKTRMRVQN